MGFPSLVYTFGWVVGLWIASYMVFPLTVLGVMGKRIGQLARRTGAITLPDLLRERYGSRAARAADKPPDHLLPDNQPDPPVQGRGGDHQDGPARERRLPVRPSCRQRRARGSSPSPRFGRRATSDHRSSCRSVRGRGHTVGRIARHAREELGRWLPDRPPGLHGHGRGVYHLWRLPGGRLDRRLPEPHHGSGDSHPLSAGDACLRWSA